MVHDLSRSVPCLSSLEPWRTGRSYRPKRKMQSPESLPTGLQLNSGTTSVIEYGMLSRPIVGGRVLVSLGINIGLSSIEGWQLGGGSRTRLPTSGNHTNLHLYI